MEIQFTPAEIEKVKELKALYPHSQAAIMPVLWMAQKKFGWLSEDVMNLVADVMELPTAHVMGVASFYTMYFKKPMGKFHVQVCTNVSCMLRGGDKIYDYVKDTYKIGHNETTPDGRISLEEVECMGACGGAPMIVVNEDYHENLDMQKVKAILAELPQK